MVMSLARLMRRSLPLTVAPILLAVFVLPRPVRAEANDKVKAAKKACIAGDYAKGVEILSDLYVETGDLNFVFNQGRCFEQNGRYQDAINRFHEYARKLKDAGKPADPEVERHIGDCQAMLGKQDGPLGAPAVPVAAAPETKTPEVSAAPVTVLPAPAAEPASPAGSRGGGLRMAGLAAVGLGVAGVITGVVLNVKANALADELDRTEYSYSRSKDATRSSYKTWGWVSYGVGAACVVGGTVLYFLGRSQGGSSEVALLPVAGPDQVGAVLQGGF
jgi:hypothetical protein